MSARPDPSAYQPPLRWWSHAWRMALCLLISAVVWSLAAEQQSDTEFVVDVGLGVLSYVLVFWRRRFPLTVALVLAVFSGVSGIAGGPGTLAGFSLATRRQWRELIPVGVVSMAAAQLYSLTQPTPDEPLWLTTLVNVLFTLVMLGWGMFLGSRRELLWTLRDRAERAEAEQHLRALSAREAERARIAREMHDVLAHRISQVSMHAGALAYRDDLSREEIRTSAAVIQSQANEALTDLRGVLGVLREPGTGAPVDRPQPTYADLPALVAEARESGMSVVYDDLLATSNGAPSPPERPTAVGRTVYRIVQEGLTNARKHAPGARVLIELSGSPDSGVDLVVRNRVGFASGPAAPGAGLGLVGLAERAQLRGGTLESRTDDGTFVLHGWIPWAA